MNNKNIKHLESYVEASNVGNLLAKDFMSRDVMVVQDGYSIKTALQILTVHDISGAPVVTSTGELIGIISSFDLLIQASSKKLDERIIFKKNPFSIQPETTLKEILILLYTKKFRRFPVVTKDNKVIGIISRIDVLSKLLKQ